MFLSQEERRVVYVGRIRGTMTQKELRERFSLFGEIEDCTLHFRDHGWVLHVHTYVLYCLLLWDYFPVEIWAACTVFEPFWSALWPLRPSYSAKVNSGLFITGASWQHSQVALLRASHRSMYKAYYRLNWTSDILKVITGWRFAHLSQGQLWVCDLLWHQGCFHGHRKWKQAAQTWWAAVRSLFWWKETVLPVQLCWPRYA